MLRDIRQLISMIISYNFYYARPGNAAAVLRQRLLASDVRARLGLQRGRIISKTEGDDDFPEVIWRLDFADMAAQDADMKVRAASPEFEAIRHGMRQLYRRFERPLYKPCGNTVAATRPTLLLHGVYCDASACDAVRTALQTVAAVEFISGGTDIPRFICETGSAGLAQSVSLQLASLGARATRSVWRIEDGG